MAFLLDTHVWLWGQLEPERLAPRVRTALESPMDPVCLSPVSVWEAMLLAERGRIRLDPDAATWVAQAVEIAGHVEAPLTFDVASASRSLDIATEDPADRFLVATALVHGLCLITSDRVLFSLWTKSRGIRAAMHPA